MIQATILAPLVLAVVLVVSAVAKLRDPDSLVEAFAQLKVPAVLAQPWLRRLVPWLELALAAGLLVLPGPPAAVAALGAVALFAVYTVLIVRAWRAPEDASCNCFGALTTGRVSGWTVARNVILLALSVVAVADAVASGGAAPRLLDAGILAWLLGAGVVALLMVAILHEPKAEPAEASAPEASGPWGEGDEGDEEFVRLPIPYSRLTTAAGQKVPLRELSAARAQLLLWVSLGCGSCTDVIARLEDWQAAMPEVDVRPVASWAGALDGSVGSLADQVLVDDDEVLRVFGSFGTPTAVLLGADGLVAGGPVSGGTAVLELVDEMLEQLAEARAAAAGAEAAPVA